MTLAIILFLITYILMIFVNSKWVIALLSAILFVALGIAPFTDILSYIDFNILLMILGTMGVVSMFIESKMPNLIVDLIVDRISNVKVLIVMIAVLSGLISMFVDNVATVLLLIPIGMQLARRVNVSPVWFIIPIAVFSNLEGAATLVGDTTSFLLASSLQMDFFDFFFFNSRIGLFFIVQFALVGAITVLRLIVTEDRSFVSNDERFPVKDYFPTLLLVMMIALLIVSSLFKGKPPLTNGIICLLCFVIGLVRYRDNALKYVKAIDYRIIILLASLFVVIGGIREVGVIEMVSNFVVSISQDPFILYTLIVVFSVIISAFVDNIPYVAIMLPIIGSISVSLYLDPVPLYYGLIIGATLGGNLTPIGSSPCLVACNYLIKNGYKIDKDFYKISVPVTLGAVIVGYLIVMFLYF